MKNSTKNLIFSLAISGGLMLLNSVKDGIAEKKQEELIEKKIKEALSKLDKE